jgi:peptide chain release factor 2
MAQSDFWNNAESAQQAVAQLKALRAVTVPLGQALEAMGHIQELLELAKDDSAAETEVRAELDRLEKDVASLELQALLSGPHDHCGALLSINAKDGGTDAHDWAEMLLRMYTMWAKSRGYSVELIDRIDHEIAGINSATIAIRGPMAYGYLKGETGIHRLVRISPFNAEGKRQTSFAAVDVSPEVDETVNIEIDEKDVREDTYCASGPGGQHVNKTASAVRLTHLPTGIVVQCQSERSQHKNRSQAWKMLRARLLRLEEEKREAELAKKYQSQAKTGFGAQIRSYFQHPEQRIKDARTDYTEYNFQAVMDGEIQGFLDAYLKWHLAQENAAVAATKAQD